MKEVLQKRKKRKQQKSNYTTKLKFMAEDSFDQKNGVFTYAWFW